MPSSAAARRCKGGATTITYNVQNSGTFSLASNDVIALSGVVSGTGAVTKLGSGIATITTVQTYTAPLPSPTAPLRCRVRAVWQHRAAFRSTALLDIADSTGATIKALTGIGTVRLGTSSLTITAGNGDFSGTITGTGC